MSKFASNVFVSKKLSKFGENKTLEITHIKGFSRVFIVELMTGFEPVTSALPICPAQKLDFALPTKTL